MRKRSFRHVGLGPAARWGIAGQVLSSLSNFVLTVAVARNVDVEVLGRFALTYLALTTLQLVLRSTLGQVILIRRGARERPTDYLAAQTILGVVGAGVTFITGSVVGLEAASTYLLAAGAVILSIQDAQRYLRIGAGKWREAAGLDAIWLSLTIPVMMLLVLLTNGAPALWQIVGAWVAGAAVSAYIGGLPRSLRLISPGVEWLKFWRRDLTPLTGEAALVTGTSYAVSALAAAFGGFGGVGLLRAAQIIFSPISSLAQASQVVLLREVSAAGEDGPSRNGVQMRPAVALGSLLGGAVVLWGQVVARTSVGEWLVGPSWSQLQPLLSLATVGVLFGVLTLMCLSAIKAVRGPRYTFFFRLGVCWIEPAAVAIGGMVMGTLGPLVGMSVSQVLVGIAALVFVAGVRRSGTSLVRRSRRERSG